MEGMWYPGEPNGGELEECATYLTTDSKYADEDCKDRYWFICVWKDTTLFTLRGLCDRHVKDQQFVLLPKKSYDGNVFFYGTGKYNIIYDKGTNRWLIVKNRAKELLENDLKLPSLKIVGSYLLDNNDKNLMPVGTHAWNWTGSCQEVLHLKLSQVRTLKLSEIKLSYY